MPKPLWFMLLILLGGAALRLHGIAWGMPYLIDGDEFRILNNGLQVYYLGTQANSPHVPTYPPFRSWEIALTRALFVLLWDEPISVPLQAMGGRLFSLFYALLTLVFFYRLGRELSPSPAAGLLAAGCFAGLSGVIWYGQTTLADGAGLMFFVAALWAGLRALRRGSAAYLAVAGVLGVLATVSKYNMGTVLLLPVLVGVILLRRDWRTTAINGVLPAALIALPIGVAAYRTIETSGFIYEYLRPDAQLRYLDTLAEEGRLSAVDQQRYEALPRDKWERLEVNARFILRTLSLPVVGAALLGTGYIGVLAIRRRRSAPMGWYLLILLGAITFVVIGSLISTGIRQMFGVMAVLIVLGAVSLDALPRKLRRFALLVAAVFLVMRGVETYRDWGWRSLPDARSATIDWFIENAPDGSRIASQPILYEFGRLHGYASQKIFDYHTVEDVYQPCLAADYLVIEVMLLNQPHAEEGFWSRVEIAAQFYPPDYAGPPRTILRVISPPNCPS